LKENEVHFRELTTKLIDINQCMSSFSKLTLDISLHCYGTKYKTKTMVGLLRATFWKNRAFWVKSMKLGTHITHSLLIIFIYRPKSAALPGDSGGHFSKWPTLFQMLLSL